VRTSNPLPAAAHQSIPRCTPPASAAFATRRVRLLQRRWVRTALQCLALCRARAWHDALCLLAHCREDAQRQRGVRETAAATTLLSDGGGALVRSESSTGLTLLQVNEKDVFNPQSAV
jgi:hypothetical protein